MPMSTIPVELMEILTQINNSVNEVKERIARIEAKDYADSIRLLRNDVVEERNKRIELQLELANVKTKLAPLLMSVSIAGAAIIQLIIQSFHLHV